MIFRQFFFLIFQIFSELDKNTVDVAAEGAILDEMLDIVAKRAALRPTIDLDSDVSHESMLAHRFSRRTSLVFVFLQFCFIYACILFYAHSR